MRLLTWLQSATLTFSSHIIRMYILFTYKQIMQVSP